MKYSYWCDSEVREAELPYSIICATLGVDNPIAWTDNRDHALEIVRALNAVCDGPFALNAIPNCVTNEIKA